MGNRDFNYNKKVALDLGCDAVDQKWRLMLTSSPKKRPLLLSTTGAPIWSET